MKAKDRTPVPNTALKERPEPVSERCFPEMEEAAASNRHRDGRGKAASLDEGLRDYKGAKRLCFLVFWAQETMPQEPERVGRAGYFK